MTAFGGAALLLCVQLASGAAVDLQASSEARTSLIATEDGPAPVLTLALSPGVRAALEGDGMAADLRYSPQLSLLVPSSAPGLPLVTLHSGALGAETVVTRRLVLRARAGGVVGDLDPGSAQRELFASLGAGSGPAAVPFASGSMELGALVLLARAAQLDMSATISGLGSPFVDAGGLRDSHTRTVAARSTLALSRVDAALIDATLRHHTLVDGGKFDDANTVGVLSALGWRRQLLRGAAAEVRAGVFSAVLDAGDRRGRQLTFLPVADGRLSASLDLGGDAALAGDVQLGLSATSDPLGALLEERVGGQLGVAARINRELSLRGALFAATSVLSFGGVPPAIAGQGASASVFYSVTEDVALNGGLQAQSRMLPGVGASPPLLAVDVTVGIGVSGTLTAFATGSRPRGSESRPGRALGEAGIGQRPPPQQPPIPEQEPTTETPVEEPLAPELVPPPVQPPLDLDSTPSRPRERRVVRPKPAPKKPAAGAESDTLPGARPSAADRDETEDNAAAADQGTETPPRSP